MLSSKRLISCVSLLATVALSVAVPADAKERIRIRAGGTTDTVTIDETASPPMITVSSGVTVRGAPGTIVALGGGKFQILVAGKAYYHLKSRGGPDTVTVVDGPGSSRYWIGVGADGDSVSIQDGPGDDRYQVEGKGGDDVYVILDDAGDGDDNYTVKGASGRDHFDISDGPGNDIYKLKGRSTAEVVFKDAGGDLDLVRTKGVHLAP